MSSFNSPPPPPFGASKWEQRAWRRQVKAANRQARWQMAQQRLQQRAARKLLRAQMRMGRRHSFAAPLILLALGAIFLLGELGRIAVATLADWYGRWWPLLLIGIGVVLLVEWAWDSNNVLPGDPPPPRRALGALGVLIVIAITISGLATLGVTRGAAWAKDNIDPNYQFSGLAGMFGHSASDTSSLESTIAPNGHLLIHNLRGAIDVSGTSSDGQIHLLAKREAHGWDDGQVHSRLQELTPVFDGSDAQRTLTVPDVDASTADLEITVPRDVTLELQGKTGKVTVSQMHAPVTLASGSGGADLTGITGRVQLTGASDDGDITAHSVTGDLALEGRAGDITISDLNGALSLHGSFFGTTQLQRIAQLTHFQTSRTDVSIARIDDSLTIESGDDLTGSHLGGPVTIVTHNRNITLDGVDGPVDIQNRNGSVTVNTVSPVAAVHIQNKNGDTEIGIPENAAATLSLTARDGELTNEFGLNNTGSEDNPVLNANLRGGGPSIAVQVAKGNLSLKHSSAGPWTREAAPKLRTEPPKPEKKAATTRNRGDDANA